MLQFQRPFGRFYLVELLVVIAIVAILAAMLLPARGWTERVRSISMNAHLGPGNGMAAGGIVDANFVQVPKMSGLVNPGPAQSWVYLDENADSINDGACYAPKSGEWIDLPANYHNGSCGVAFADRHAEVHKWQASAKNWPVRMSSFSAPGPLRPDNDISWMRERTQRKPGTY